MSENSAADSARRAAEQLLGAGLDTRARVLLGHGRVLYLDRPRIMGIVNVTPDSFSDGGHHATTEAAVDHALRLIEEGADLIDIGGESTRPGAAPVDAESELARVVPVIDALMRRADVLISIDTSKPEVMRAAVNAGACLINDVRALREPGAMQAAVETGAGICLMHMKGTPGDMQRAPRYGDPLATAPGNTAWGSEETSVIDEVRSFLAERVMACQLAGVSNQRLLLDPGFGFGKSLDHNLALLAGLDLLLALGAPLLVGLSRKSMLGQLTDRPVEQRLAGSMAAAVLAVERGAAVVRVHDVAATRDALRVLEAVQAMQKKVRKAPAKPDPLAQARALFGDE